MFQGSFLLTLSVFACGFGLQAQTSTLAATRGSYSFVEEGVNAQGLRYSRIGTFRLDGSGGVSGASVSKAGSAAALSSSLTGSYLMADDGSISIQFVTTETSTEENPGDAITVINSSLKLLPSGKGRWTGLRTDPGANALIQAEPVTASSLSNAATYTFVEDGVSALNAPYATVGTVLWDTKADVSATLLQRTSTVDSIQLNGTLMVSPDDIATMVLRGLSADGDELSRATYAGVPVDDGKNWALIRMDVGVQGSGKLVSR